MQARESSITGHGTPLALKPCMKKTPAKKLALRSQTVRALTAMDVGSVAGGLVQPALHGFIMQDTVIIRTGR